MRGAPPSGGVSTRLWPMTHIWWEKSNFKFEREEYWPAFAFGSDCNLHEL